MMIDKEKFVGTEKQVAWAATIIENVLIAHDAACEYVDISHAKWKGRVLYRAGKKALAGDMAPLENAINAVSEDEHLKFAIAEAIAAHKAAFIASISEKESVDAAKIINKWKKDSAIFEFVCESQNLMSEDFREKSEKYFDDFYDSNFADFFRSRKK